MYIVKWTDQSWKANSRTFDSIDDARTFANSLRAGGAYSVGVYVNDF